MNGYDDLDNYNVDPVHDAGRVLFIAPFKTNAARTSRYLCQQRNEFVASISDELVFSSLTPDSSLYHLTQCKSQILML